MIIESANHRTIVALNSLQNGKLYSTKEALKPVCPQLAFRFTSPADVSEAASHVHHTFLL